MNRQNMNQFIHSRGRFLCIGIFMCLLSACSSDRSDFQLVPEFKAATKTYHDGDIKEAENALYQFVSRTEDNIETARADREGSYKKLLDMSWLRLASIYRVGGNTVKYREAMAKAISYFDQDSASTSNLEYQKDKEGSLLKLLDQLEAVNMPSWRRKASSDGQALGLGVRPSETQ